MIFLIYWVETGRVERVIFAPSSEYAKLQLEAGQNFVEGTGDDVTHYVVNGEVIPRPEFPISQLDDTLTVPIGTEFSIYGPVFISGVATDGILEFEFSEPGRYIIHLSLWPYKDAEVILEN
jgi:hypothetical protein